MTQLKEQLLQLFFMRAPSGIVGSSVSKVYKKTFQTALCLIDESLPQFITSHLNEYIDECQTLNRNRLYYFRSSSELSESITNVLMALDLNTRRDWIARKMKVILSLYKSGIDWVHLKEAVRSFGPFELTRSLLSEDSSPPHCIESLKSLIPEMNAEWRSDIDSYICKLQNDKKAIHISVHSYYQLILEYANSLDDEKELFIEDIEKAFNKKYPQIPMIIETPLILNQIRNSIDQRVFNECKRFKIKRDRERYPSSSSTNSSSPPPGGGPDDLNPEGLAEIHGVTNRRDLNKKYCKLMHYKEDTGVWIVIITTGRLAGHKKAISRMNLRPINNDDIKGQYSMRDHLPLNQRAIE